MQCPAGSQASRQQRLLPAALGIPQMFEHKAALCPTTPAGCAPQSSVAAAPICRAAGSRAIHAGADHVERPIRDHADTHIGLHHPADRIEARHMNAQAERLARLGSRILRAQVDRTRRVQADMVESSVSANDNDKLSCEASG